MIDNSQKEKNIEQPIVLNTAIEEFIIFNRYSSWTKLTRVIAYCLRFKQKTRTRAKNDEHNKTLSTKKAHDAEICLLKIAHIQAFARELKTIKKNVQVERHTKLMSLSPFIEYSELEDVGTTLLTIILPDYITNKSSHHMVILHNVADGANLMFETYL